MHFSKTFLALFIGILILGCTEYNLDRTSFTSVITVGAIEVGSNSAFLLGDIQDIRTSSVVENGFVLSSSANDDLSLRLDQSSVIKVLVANQDTIAEDRAFAARASGLNASTTYFFRAFIRFENEEEVAYGNIDQFSTNNLSLSIENVRRTSSDCFTTVLVEMSIIGFNAQGGGEIGIVISEDFGNLSPTIDQDVFVSGETPNADGKLIVPFNVECEKSYFIRGALRSPSGETQYSDLYAFSMKDQGEWHISSPFAGSNRKDPYVFSIGNEFYIGSGHSSSTILSDLNKFDLISQSWQRIGEYEELETTQGVGFSVNGAGYLLNGRIDYTKCGLRDDCGCVATACNSAEIATCIKTECDFFIFDRESDFIYCDCYDNKLLAYQPLNSELMDLGTFPGTNRKSSVGLFSDNNFFFGLGINHFSDNSNQAPSCAICDESAFPNDFWVFEPNDLTWRKVDPLPGLGRMDALSFWILDKGFVGMGKTVLYTGVRSPMGVDNRRIIETQFRDFYSFDPHQSSGSQWTQVEDFPGQGVSYSAFSCSSNGYVLTSDKFGGESQFWKFDPLTSDLGSWTKLEIPIGFKGIPEASSTLGNMGLVYLANSVDNFWIYIPELN